MTLDILLSFVKDAVPYKTGEELLNYVYQSIYSETLGFRVIPKDLVFVLQTSTLSAYTRVKVDDTTIVYTLNVYPPVEYLPLGPPVLASSVYSPSINEPDGETIIYTVNKQEDVPSGITPSSASTEILLVFDYEPEIVFNLIDERWQTTSAVGLFQYLAVNNPQFLLFDEDIRQSLIPAFWLDKGFDYLRYSIIEQITSFSQENIDNQNARRLKILALNKLLASIKISTPNLWKIRI